MAEVARRVASEKRNVESLMPRAFGEACARIEPSRVREFLALGLDDWLFKEVLLPLVTQWRVRKEREKHIKSREPGDEGIESVGPRLPRLTLGDDIMLPRLGSI